MVSRRVKTILTIVGGILLVVTVLPLLLGQTYVALALGTSGIIIRVIANYLPLTPFQSISSALHCPSCGMLYSSRKFDEQFLCPLCGYSG